MTSRKKASINFHFIFPFSFASLMFLSLCGSFFTCAVQYFSFSKRVSWQEWKMCFLSKATAETSCAGAAVTTEHAGAWHNYFSSFSLSCSSPHGPCRDSCAGSRGGSDGDSAGGSAGDTGDDSDGDNSGDSAGDKPWTGWQARGWPGHSGGFAVSPCPARSWPRCWTGAPRLRHPGKGAIAAP